MGRTETLTLQDREGAASKSYIIWTTTFLLIIRQPLLLPPLLSLSIVFFLLYLILKPLFPSLDCELLKRQNTYLILIKSLQDGLFLIIQFSSLVSDSL